MLHNSFTAKIKTWKKTGVLFLKIVYLKVNNNNNAFYCTIVILQPQFLQNKPNFYSGGLLWIFTDTSPYSSLINYAELLLMYSSKIPNLKIPNCTVNSVWIPSMFFCIIKMLGLYIPRSWWGKITLFNINSIKKLFPYLLLCAINQWLYCWSRYRRQDLVLIFVLSFLTGHWLW